MAAAAGTGIAVAALVAAAISGPPFLSFSDLNPWIVVFAAASLTALMAVPFALDRALERARPGQGDKWEKAVALWGGLCLLVAAAGLGLILAGDGSASDLSHAAGVILAIEAGLAEVVFWVLLLGG